MNGTPPTSVEFPQAACRLGVARADITPPADIYHRMWGAASHDRAEGIHRPLTATAVVLQPLDAAPAVDAASVDAAAAGDSDRQVQVLLAIDHCLLGAEAIDAVRDAVSRRVAVPRSAILVHFSHTHAAGLMLPDRQELPGGERIAPYLARLYQQAAELVAEAVSNAVPCTLAFGQGRCGLAANRDYWDADRRQFVCGYNPAQPADDTLLVVRASDSRQRTLAVLVNYACHPTTLAWDNRLISPDYPGAMREVIERETGAACVFLQGAAGDLGPREGFVGDASVADRNGQQLGHAALAALAALPPPATRYDYAGPVISGATIGTWHYQPLDDRRLREIARWNVLREEIPLDYRAELPRAAQVQAERDRWLAEEHAAREQGDSRRAADCRAMIERQTRLLSRIGGLPAGPSYPLEIVVGRLGDAVWVGVQGEPYSQFQQELRRRFHPRPILVSTVCNSWGPSYLVPARCYGQGLYQESVAVLAAGCLERLTDEVAQRMERLLAE
ncbi:MAG: hypothetical protein J5I93_04450 [Pirellulaceae bacterium]|nr:hypothetical protein [Pirellulaceae bacterium]